MTCHLPGSASASLETGALRKFRFPAFSSPGCTHKHIHASKRSYSPCVCGSGIVLNSGNLVVLSAQFVPQISADSSVEVINFCRTPQWYMQRVSPKFDTIKMVARAVEQVLSWVLSDPVRLSRVG
jgi:hypothetical protein